MKGVTPREKVQFEVGNGIPGLAPILLPQVDFVVETLDFNIVAMGVAKGGGRKGCSPPPWSCGPLWAEAPAGVWAACRGPHPAKGPFLSK